MGRPKGSKNKNTLAKMGINMTPEVIDSRTDYEILSDIIGRFNLFRELIVEASQESGRCVAISGAPGVGKSYELERQISAAGIPSTVVSGSISGVELYALAYKHRQKGDMIVLDDADSIMGDEEGVNLLKIMMDTGKTRTLSWRKQNQKLEDAGVEAFFQFEGSVIACSNLDWQSTIEAGRSKYAAHLQALMDRCLYLNLRIHDRRSIRLWIEYVATEGKMFRAKHIPEALGREYLTWMSDNQEKLAQYSLRTLDKLCEMKGKPDWKERARMTLFR